MKSLRTRNRFSASTVDQIPHQFVALAALRPPAAAPGPRHRPHLVLPGARRQPDGLQRLADDGARTSRSGCATSRRAAGSWWCSTRGAPRPRRSPPSTTSSGPAPTPPCCSRCCRCCSRRGSPLPRRTSTTSTGCADLVAPFTARAGRASSGVPAEEIRRLTRDFAAADGGRGLRPDGPVDPGLRLGVPVGDPPAQPADRQLRPRGRRAVHRAGRGHRRPADRRPGPPRRLAQPGPRHARSSRASCRPRRCPRRSRRPGRPDPRDGDDRRQPGAVHARRPRPGPRLRRPRLHGRRSTSTSTRPPATPT